jgi:hypothetical protein
MASKVPEIIVGAVRDLLSWKGVPGGTLSAALREFEQRREEELRKLLFQELKAGEKTVTDVMMQDQLFAIWVRLRHAAITGVARQKLRLMARYLNGQLENDRLSTDAFSQFAGMIEGLRIEELVYLVTMEQVDAETPREEASRGDRDAIINKAIRDRLIPKWFPDQESLEAVGIAVQRTGFIVPPDYLITGQGDRRPSSMLAELVHLAKVDAQFFDV